MISYFPSQLFSIKTFPFKTFPFKTSFAWYLLALLVFPSQTFGQDWARKMFAETSHSFGNVSKGDFPEFRFEVQNIYEEDMHIASVQSSCGCTSVSMTKNTLKTWEKGEIVCRFNSPAFDGFKQATITVRFDRPYIGEVQLMVSGNIVRTSGVNFSPQSIDFGQVTEANLPSRAIKVSSAGNPNLRILDVKSTFSHIKVQLKPPVRVNNQIQYEMVTQLKPGVPVGYAQGELYVVVEENQVRREIPIRFNAKVVPALQLPESITLGPLSPGQEIKKKVILKADREFQITDVTCQSTAFRVKADRESKKVHFVELIYTGEDNPGRHECELSFFIDKETQPAGKMKAVVEIVPGTKPPETAAQ